MVFKQVKRACNFTLFHYKHYRAFQKPPAYNRSYFNHVQKLSICYSSICLFPSFPTSPLLHLHYILSVHLKLSCVLMKLWWSPCMDRNSLTYIHLCLLHAITFTVNNPYTKSYLYLRSNSSDHCINISRIRKWIPLKGLMHHSIHSVEQHFHGITCFLYCIKNGLWELLRKYR